MRQLILSLVITIAFCNSSTLVHAQSENTFYKKKNYYTIAFGLLHNQPQYNKSNNFFKFGFIPDLSFEIGITNFVTSKHGWQIAVGSSTKNRSIKFKDSSNYYAKEAYWGLDYWYYHLKINKTYSFNLTEKYNAIISSGPVLFFNDRRRLNDSLQLQNYNATFYNDIRAFGIGININLNVTRAITKNKYFLLSVFYQQGFINFLQLNAVNESFPNERIIYNYNGSGAGIRIGILM